MVTCVRQVSAVSVSTLGAVIAVGANPHAMWGWSQYTVHPVPIEDQDRACMEGQVIRLCDGVSWDQLAQLVQQVCKRASQLRVMHALDEWVLPPVLWPTQ